MATRSDLLEMIRQYPGLHQRELARQLGVAVNLVQHHLKQLMVEREVFEEERDGTRRYYPAGFITDRAALASLRDRRRLHIVMTLLEHGSMRHAGLVDATRMSKSTLSFHLRKLAKVGIVAQNAGKYRLVDEAATRRLLEAHCPTPDLLDRFSRLWGDLYDP